MASVALRTLASHPMVAGARHYTGKYGLKALAKGAELGARFGTKVIGSLAESEQAQVLATTGGMIAASVAFPPVGLGIGAIALGKFVADKILGKRREDGQKKTLLDSVRETILLGNRLTRKVCREAISPAMQKANLKSKEIGQVAQAKISEKFDGR